MCKKMGSSFSKCFKSCLGISPDEPLVSCTIGPIACCHSRAKGDFRDNEEEGETNGDREEE